MSKRNQIDIYLKKVTRNNKLPALTFEEGLRLLFQYCNEFKKVLVTTTKYLDLIKNEYIKNDINF